MNKYHLGADSRVEINMAYINTVCTWYYLNFPTIGINLQKNSIYSIYQDMTCTMY